MYSAVRNFFSSSLLFWEIAGYVCTFVVISGCVGEYFAEFAPIKKSKEWKHKLSKLALIVLTAGIAGELLTAIQASRISGQVISDLEGIVKAARESASDAAADALRAKGASDEAARKADGASDVAARAQGEAQAANLEADRAKRKAMDASNAAALAGTSADDAAARALMAKRYTDSIAASVNSRQIDRKQFVNVLAGKPKGTAEVWYEPGDLEAKEYAEQIADLLGPNGAGWEVTSPRMLPQKELPETYNDETSLLDKLRIDASANSGISIGGGKPLGRDNPPADDLWTLLEQATSSLEGIWVIHWGGIRHFNPPGIPETHFTIVVGHHRADILRMTMPWENTQQK